MASISTKSLASGSLASGSPVARHGRAARATLRLTGERLTRYSLAALGIACVGMGALGVVVPGLPTTVFLIIAAWCFARSCPWLTDKLIHHRFFGPFVKYIVPGAVMPRRAKAISIAIMWAAIVLSCLLIVSGDAPAWVPATVVLAGVVGTWFIARQGRNAPRTGADAEQENARVHHHPLGRSLPAHKNPPCTNTTGGRSKTH